MNSRKIAKNTSFLLISKILSYLIGFFFIIYMARYLGVEGFGVLSFALAFTGIFGIIADMGFGTLIVREIARDTSLTTKYLSNVAIIKLFLALITFGLIFVSSQILGYPQQTLNIVYLIAISVIINSFTQIFYSIFQSYENMEYQSYGLVLNNVLMLLGVLILINFNYNIVYFALLYIITSIIVFLYIFVISLKNGVVPKIELDKSFCKSIIIQTIPFTLIGGFVTINQNIDRIMISKMVDMNAVGWYSSAYNLVLMLEFIPAAFIASIYPITSKFHASKDKLDFLVQRGAKYLLILGLPIGFGTTLLANKIILLIYGPSFIPSVTALQILVWSEVLIFIGILFNNLLISINKQMSVTKQMGIIVLINIISNLILIPKYGFIGASISTLLTSFIGFAILYYYVSKQDYIKLKRLFKPFIKILIACLIMSIYLITFRWLSIFPLILSSAIIYFILLYLLKILDETDYTIIRSIIRSK
jgi:O-antigen/teichoic acid export membrane protein